MPKMGFVWFSLAASFLMVFAGIALAALFDIGWLIMTTLGLIWMVLGLYWMFNKRLTTVCPNCGYVFCRGFHVAFRQQGGRFQCPECGSFIEVA